MRVAPYAPRLQQLYALRERLNIEIAAEEKLREARQVAAEKRRRLVEPTDSEIRAWAKSQGLPVGDRGRIPAPIRQQYLDTNAGLLALVPEEGVLAH